MRLIYNACILYYALFVQYLYSITINSLKKSRGGRYGYPGEECDRVSAHVDFTVTVNIPEVPR